MSVQEMITKLQELGIWDWAVNIVGAILIFFIGRWVPAARRARVQARGDPFSEGPQGRRNCGGVAVRPVGPEEL